MVDRKTQIEEMSENIEELLAVIKQLEEALAEVLEETGLPGRAVSTRRKAAAALTAARDRLDNWDEWLMSRPEGRRRTPDRP